MRCALLNPNWTFSSSTYFGCREPHLPLELGYARAGLERAGHEVLLVDAHMGGLSPTDVRARLAAFAPEMTVITTAPTYLFWRCPQPELRVPAELARAVRRAAGTLVAAGPHGSAAPGAALRKLGAEAVVLGECEIVLVALAEAGVARWEEVPSLARSVDGAVVVNGEPAATPPAQLPALFWPAHYVARHRHHHHRFEAPPLGLGAEVEASRGCPYRCLFCAKLYARDRYRRRPLPEVLMEIDALLAQGVTYVYFIDEIFLPDEELLRALAARPVKFGVQTRLDLWERPMLDLLGEAGCVSIEAGVESITAEGQRRLGKHPAASMEEITERLVYARRTVPFVQANLIASEEDNREQMKAWRARMAEKGVWANAPVPLFPYPGSLEYLRRWGLPDDDAWERAHAHYLAHAGALSDVQEAAPCPLAELETAHAG